MPLTLTAVHHLLAEDSGIGSGVLNTMQQVGGALGLSPPRRTLVAQHPQQRSRGARSSTSRRMPEGQVSQLAQPPGRSPRARPRRLPGRRRPDAAALAGRVALPNVKHEELATDGPEDVPVHAGLTATHR